MSSLKRLIVYVKSITFAGRAMHDLKDRKYDQVARQSKAFLEKHPNNLQPLYMLALVAYYRDDFETCMTYYKRMLEHTRVPRQQQYWFSTQIPSPTIYKQHRYEIVEGWCRELLPLTTARKAIIELLKYQCVSLYMLGRYQRVIEVCQTLRDGGFIDDTLVNYEKKAMSVMHEN